jgi:hypothetical protein
MSLDITALWFKRAIPNPTEKQLNTQISVHFEDVAEMLAALQGASGLDEHMRNHVKEEIELFSRALRSGDVQMRIADREEFLDSIADQIVTATGCGHMAGMNVPEALNRVNTSNFSKFDSNGFPIFDENGKIAKNKVTYHKPNLTGLY